MSQVLLSKEKYASEIRPEIAKKYSIKNPMALPFIEKIVISTSLGQRATDKNYMASVEKVFSMIAGQKCVVVKSKKSIASFKVREGMNIGTMVTLRKSAMYNFLDRLVYINLPRIKDFKGFSTKSFDTSFNFNIGISDCSVFHEVEYGMLTQPFGMSITISIKNAHTKDQALDLLKGLMLPIK